MNVSQQKVYLNSILWKTIQFTNILTATFCFFGQSPCTVTNIKKNCKYRINKNGNKKMAKMAINSCNFVKDWVRWTLAGAGIVEPPAGLGYWMLNWSGKVRFWLSSNLQGLPKCLCIFQGTSKIDLCRKSWG